MPDQPYARVLFLFAFFLLLLPAAFAEDVEGVVEHPMVERYPGQDIRWQQIENYMPYRVAIGPVTGYRRIDDWIDTQGRVTRTFYQYDGTGHTYSEIYLNYLEALKAQDFEILGEGLSADRRGAGLGSTNWIGVSLGANKPSKPGAVNSLFAGTSSSGGAGSIVARKTRAAGIAYVVINVEQHSAEMVGTLIDIIEVAAAETGLIVIDAEAIGTDMEEYGRVVLDGIVFDFNSADLLPASNEALDAMATYLGANPDKRFYVVGHTDAVGTFAYNSKLSADRARAVVAALVDPRGIATERIEAHGVGPLVPVFSNANEAGRDKNRRVELVERQAEE